MIIIYRTNPYHNPLKVEPEGGKLELVRRCFNSLVKAFEGVDHELKVLIDKPNVQFREMFKGYDTEELYTETFTEGNTTTFHRQIDLALEHGGNFLFVEDDYMFLPGSGKIIVEALKHLPLITPYDHPDHYDKDYKRDVKLLPSHHWLSVESCTLTFGGQHEVLKQEAELIKSYGWADEPMFKDVTQRHKLYCPIPSLASHMEKGYEAPLIEW